MVLSDAGSQPLFCIGGTRFRCLTMPSWYKKSRHQRIGQQPPQLGRPYNPEAVDVEHTGLSGLRLPAVTWRPTRATDLRASSDTYDEQVLRNALSVPTIGLAALPYLGRSGISASCLDAVRAVLRWDGQFDRR